MTRAGPKDVELVGHRYRSHCRPGAEAGPESETQVPEPFWDRGTETSQRRIWAARVEIVSLGQIRPMWHLRNSL
jgi:hypothetical protein